MAITASVFMASGPRLLRGRICTHAMKWKMVRKAVDVQEAPADQGAAPPWTSGNNCPPVEKMNYFEPDSPGDDLPEPLPDFQNMSRKERRELTARLRQVKPKRRKGYKQEINDQLRLQLEIELKSRALTEARPRSICCCVVAVSHQVPGCGFLPQSAPAGR